MNATEVKLEFELCEQKKSGLSVIIVAGGSSTRMKGVNKLFLQILGVPVIARTLMAFENSPEISKIILVSSKESIADMQLVCEKYAISKLTDIVEGGSDRHSSVKNGISRLDAQDKKVLIHDGARPFVSGDIIAEVASALDLFDAAVCVGKINDTVKIVNTDGVVEKTLDRTKLYAAQTPQGVDVKKYIDACNTLENPNSFTDDASVMEAAGYRVKAVSGSSKNIKITTPDDLILANSIAEGE